MTDRSKGVLTEILDWFNETGKTPGDWWAPTDDRMSYGLDWRDDNGQRKFWLDLDKNGTVSIFWKRPDGTSETLVFDERS